MTTAANQAFDVFFIGFFLLAGLWFTAYAYGFIGEVTVGNYKIGNPAFRPHLRWRAPLLFTLCVAAIAFSIWGHQLTGFVLECSFSHLARRTQ